jgi:carboxylesterase
VNLLALLAVIAFGWVVRRSIGRWTERSMLARLPLRADGIIEGAAGSIRPGSASRAVLIFHGFGDTPQTLHYLAEHLHGLGFTVHAPLLPGHGRTLAEFGASGADAWLAAADHQLAALRSTFDFVGLVGVSMGGALAVILAARSVQAATDSGRSTKGAENAAGRAKRGPDALVLLAPYLNMRPRAQRLATMHWMVSPFAIYLPSREEGSIRDRTERTRNRGFGIVTPGLLKELRQIVRRAQRALPDVRQPTLVIQSRDDNRIEAAAATRSFDRLGSGEKRFVWTEGSGHVITVDTGRERVMALTGEWLLERADAIAPHSQPPPPTS